MKSRAQLRRLQSLWDSLTDGDEVGNSQIWGVYKAEGTALRDRLQREVGPEYRVVLWLPTFLRD
jgi:hypothetical protein